MDLFEFALSSFTVLSLCEILLGFFMVVLIKQKNSEMKKMTYGAALLLLKQGRLVARMGWNGKNMFIFMRPYDRLPLSVLLGAKSIPKGVKDYFERHFQLIFHDNKPTVEVTAYLCLKAADDSIVNGWLPSQTDMLADDWVEVQFGEEFGFDFASLD